MKTMRKYSQLKNTRVNLRGVIPLKKPFTVLFEPASLCNFRCTCCYYNIPNLYSQMPKGWMKFEDFKKIADDLADWEGEKIKVIRIIGFGEPFINKNTPNMVRYLEELDIALRIEITTNGSLITPGISQQLIDAELDYLRISIYGASQERHNAVARSNVKVNTIKKNIALLKKMRDEQLKDKPFIYVKMLDSFDEVENKNFFDMYADVADEISLEKPHQWLDKDKSEGENASQRIVCPQPFKMISIRFNGDVIVCDPDWKNKTFVGNALEQSIKDIWNGKKMNEFWRMQLENRRCENESCRECTFLTNDSYVIDNLDGVSPNVLKKDE